MKKLREIRRAVTDCNVPPPTLDSIKQRWLRSSHHERNGLKAWYVERAVLLARKLEEGLHDKG